MSISYSESIARFSLKRKAFNEELDASRVKVDYLLDELPSHPSHTMLATLEVILKERRDLLAELVALDEEFLNELIQHLESLGDEESA